VNTPKTRYTKSGGANIAYQVFGDKPRDLVVVNGWFSPVELGWESSTFTRFYERLASFARLILFDKRGTGMSDRVSAEQDFGASADHSTL
jgi:pimeloyl-ACP methyl ester carboxylesterase